MGAHTPGPWRIWKRSDGDFITNERGDEGVCRLMQRPRKPHEELPNLVEANARLIAAAPELLAALILCRSALNEEIIAAGDLDHPTIRAHAKAAAQADAAIAKAEGRP
jgi:hypothetical protein